MLMTCTKATGPRRHGWALAVVGLALFAGLAVATSAGRGAAAQSGESAATEESATEAAPLTDLEMDADPAAEAVPLGDPEAARDDPAAASGLAELGSAPAGLVEVALASPAQQTSDAGRVTIVVTWPGPSAGPTFAVVMDTHSVDLDRYDLRQLAALRTDEGREVRPSGWDAPKGGHHRSGALTFPATAPDGSPLIGPATRTVELLVRDVAGVKERPFRWTLALPAPPR